MTTNRTLAGLSVALVGGALGGLLLAPSAAARSADVYSSHPAASVAVCPLERVGTQFVRCDNLTGNGVPAPLFIPEAH